MTDTLFYENFFAQDSLLRNDSLLFRDRRHEVCSTPTPATQLMPGSVQRNDFITASLFFSFLLLTFAVRAKARSYEVMLALLALCTSLLTGVVTYAFAYASWDISSPTLPAIVLPALYVAATMAVLLLKQRLYHVVHSTFFTPARRLLWRRSYARLFLLQTTLLFPLALATVYLHLTPENIAYGAAGVLLFVKTWLLKDSFSRFFDKIHGLLHLFVYFCALEALPLLLLGSALATITLQLTAFFF